MKKILVLCSGNSSRSQMAEAYLSFYAKNYGVFFSAGLRDRGVNPITIDVMAEDNLDISDKYSKSYEVFNDENFDYLLTVCNEARQKLPETISADRHIHFNIPDPDEVTGNSQERYEAFRQIRDMVKKKVLKFIGRELTDSNQTVSI